MSSSSEAVKTYFKDNFTFFRYLWANSNNLAMHIGFWDNDTKNKAQALENENRYVCSKLSIKDGDRVLDIGCGMGGTSIWMAKKNDIFVTGIDFVEENIETAIKAAKYNNVGDRVCFTKSDFLNFSTNQKYDRILSIEGFAYAIDKKLFIKKYLDYLGSGKMVIADYFKTREISEVDDQILDKWNKTWSYPGLITVNDLTSIISGIDDGVSVKLIDLSKKMIRSSEILNNISRKTYPVLWILNRLKLLRELPEWEAINHEVRLFRDGVIKYYVIVIEKRPNNARCS